MMQSRFVWEKWSTVHTHSEVDVDHYFVLILHIDCFEIQLEVNNLITFNIIDTRWQFQGKLHDETSIWTFTCCILYLLLVEKSA